MTAFSGRLLLACLMPALLLAGCSSPQSAAKDSTTPGAGEPGNEAATNRPPGTDSAPSAVVPVWPDISSARIRPGGFLQGQAEYNEPAGAGGCTSNFVFYDGRDGRVFLGTSAHCFQDAEYSPVGASGQCDEMSFLLGKAIHIDGASEPGALAYSSWMAMRAVGEADPGVCDANDFALVSLAFADVPFIHPAVLHFGGPVSELAATSIAGRSIVSYGSSPHRAVNSELDAASGRVIETTNGGWHHIATFRPVRIPGDSGSGVLTDTGEALGVINTLNLGANNGVSDLAHVLDYAREATGWDLRLATWGQFNPETLLPPPDLV